MDGKGERIRQVAESTYQSVIHQRVGFPSFSLPSSLLDFVFYLLVDAVLLNTVLTKCT